ncbi:MAG TPA: peptide chain release factor N(5)-glutamine methyltransferase [Candidatus Saccharimonadales bacterium]|nr:peptide chain release factor N(5)-glutamine methyltransferase [Candidatus Saccharimonadales bacterium]
MTAQEWLAKSKLTELDSRLILEKATGRKREYLLAHPDTALSPTELERSDRLASQRLTHKPMSQVLGQREFYGLEFKITPDVLTPRSETEVLVEQVIAQAPKAGVLLDLGTGCGAIAIAIARHRPDLVLTASDISPSALAIAQQNAQKHGAEINFLTSDLFQDVNERFDCITANLPYLCEDAELMPEVRQHEPRVALIGGSDGLDLYRRFFRQTQTHLKPLGLIYIEADPWQHPELVELARAAGLKPMFEDYFILGFKQPVIVEQPLASH